MQIENYNGVVPDRIYEIITQKGLKINAIAKMANMKPSELYSAIANRRIIKPDELPRLAIALGVSVDDLFQES